MLEKCEILKAMKNRWKKRNEIPNVGETIKM
jgi:hypothetical protein